MNLKKVPDDVPCRTTDPDLWFTHPGSPDCNKAKALCLHCPIYWECAEHALQEGIPVGVFGGLSERDRRIIWKRQGGRPTAFDDAIDAATRPLLQARRDAENGRRRKAS